MKKIFFIKIMFVLSFKALNGMQVLTASEEATQALSRGLHLLALGEKKDALNCFLKVVEDGNDQERSNAKIYIRNLLAKKTGNSARGVEPNSGMVLAINSNNNQANKVNRNLRIKNEAEITKVREDIALMEKQRRENRCEKGTLENRQTPWVDLARRQAFELERKAKIEQFSTTIAALTSKLEDAYRTLYKLESEKIWLLEEAGQINEPDFLALCAARESQNAFFESEEPEIKAYLVSEYDFKALEEQEIKYYFANGRWCITAGFFPDKPLVQAETEEMQQRIAFGQHVQEAQWIPARKNGKKKDLFTSGFVPLAWGQSMYHEPKRIWIQLQTISAKKKSDTRELLALQLMQARQTVEERLRQVQLAKQFYMSSLAGTTDQQGIDRLKAEVDKAEIAHREALIEVQRLTAELQ